MPTAGRGIFHAFLPVCLGCPLQHVEATCSSHQSKDPLIITKPQTEIPAKESSNFHKGTDAPYPGDFQAFFVQQPHRLKEEKDENFQISNILIFTHIPSALIIRAHKLPETVQFSVVSLFFIVNTTTTNKTKIPVWN